MASVRSSFIKQQLTFSESSQTQALPQSSQVMTVVAHPASLAALTFIGNYLIVGGRVDAMGTRIDNVGNRVDAVGIRVDAVGIRVDEVQKTTNELLNRQNQQDKRALEALKGLTVDCTKGKKSNICITSIGSEYQKAGDFAYPNFLPDLEMILNNSVRVALFYGDADYICNWFGGEAVTLNTTYTHTEEFKKTGYVPFVVDGEEYGEVRQYGDYSFARIYQAGHEIPFYQPKASLEFFRRTLEHLDIATGETVLTENYNTTGSPNATHTESFVPIPTATGTESLLSYTAAITNPLTTVPAESVVPVSGSTSSATTSDLPARPRGPEFVKRRLEDVVL